HKRQCSFQSYGDHDRNKLNLLPVCSVCLGCFSHNDIYCNATHTWDKAHPTFAECHRTALYAKDGCLCCKWQKDKGCNEKHDTKHTCSGCGFAAHGAQCCPHAQ
ncbi:hypothetical protein PAXRUDRAFT_89401, partial [Paxillus rubicundulus Ve08.2h10]